MAEALLDALEGGGAVVAGCDCAAGFFDGLNGGSGGAGDDDVDGGFEVIAVL